MDKTQINEFFERLDLLSKGERTQLKRNAGRLLDEVDARTLSTFFKVLPSGQKSMLDRWLSAACIHCLWDNSTHRVSPEHAIGDLVRKKALTESYLGRVYALMDTEWDRDGFMIDKYLKLMKMLKSKGYSIDGRFVLEDLITWNSDYRIAQKRWAKAIANIQETEGE